ncbi:MAG: NAD-dependent epimerase/dehydratase family protein [Thermoplasmata archaeon]
MIGKKFLIAGGAGFIGSHLVKRLLRIDDINEVTVLDNFSSGSLQNLAGLGRTRRLRIHECDITNRLPEVGEMDVILHLAACANPTDYEKRPVETLLVNSRGNENLLALAQRSGARYVYFSSSEVYGNRNPMPPLGLREQDECRIAPGQPRSCYPIGKMFGEEVVRSVSNRMSLDYLIVRPFNVYGPNMDPNTKYGRVIPNFIKWARSGLPLKVNGDGTQERSFCHIDDFIDCMISLLERPFPPERIVNIGNPEPVSILTLAFLVNEVVGNRSGITFAERYPFEPQYRTPNIDRVKKWTGWRPRISLLKGLEMVVNGPLNEQAEVVI